MAHVASSVETCESRDVDKIHSDIRATNEAVATLINRAFAEVDLKLHQLMVE